MTLVDLPGLTRLPVGDQPSDIEARLRAMILGYIRAPSCLILAVSPANQDIVNSDALDMARQVDPQGRRTIGGWQDRAGRTGGGEWVTVGCVAVPCCAALPCCCFCCCCCCFLVPVAPARTRRPPSPSQLSTPPICPSYWTMTVPLRTVPRRTAAGVLTKLDIMDRGTDAVGVLRGEVVPLALGFVGLVLRCQEDIANRRSMAEARGAERAFFEGRPEYLEVAGQVRWGGRGGGRGVGVGCVRERREVSAGGRVWQGV